MPLRHDFSCPGIDRSRIAAAKMGNRKIAKSGHQVVAEMISFPRRWHGGMISANLKAIWGMSAKLKSRL